MSLDMSSSSRSSWSWRSTDKSYVGNPNIIANQNRRFNNSCLLDNFVVYADPSGDLFAERIGHSESVQLVCSDVVQVCGVDHADAILLLNSAGELSWWSEFFMATGNDRALQSGILCSFPPLTDKFSREKCILAADGFRKYAAIIVGDLVTIINLEFDEVMGIPTVESQKPLRQNKLVLSYDYVEELYHGCSFWGIDGRDYFAAFGNGTWMHIWDLNADEANCLVIDTAHTTWLRSLSSGIPSPFVASGDSSGCVIFWNFNDVNESTISPPQSSHLPLRMIAHEKHSMHDYHAVIKIVVTGNDICWIGDESGTVTEIRFVAQLKTSQKLRRVVSPVWSNVTSIIYSQLPQGGTGSRKLRLLAGYSGMAAEYCFDDSSLLMFPAVSRAPADRMHRSNITVCAVHPTLDYLTSAGMGSKLSVWDLKTGELVAVVSSPSSACTAISWCLPLGPGIHGGDAVIWSGHSDGSIHEFSVTLPTAQDAQRSSVHGVAMSRSQSDVDDILDAVLGIPSPKRKAAVGDTDFLTATKSLDIDDDFLLAQVSLRGSFKYTSLPVTTIMVSSGRGYVAMCFAHSSIVVHDRLSGRAMLQLDLDAPLCSISKVEITHTEAFDLGTESLLLLLQGEKSAKVLDAVKGTIVHEVMASTFPLSATIVSGVFWHFQQQKSLASPSNETIMPAVSSTLPRRRRSTDVPIPIDNNAAFAGLLVSQSLSGPSVLSYDDKRGFGRVPVYRCEGSMEDPVGPGAIPTPKEDEEDSPESDPALLDTVILGAEGFSAGRSPVAVIWTMRAVHVLRVSLDPTDGVTVPRWRRFEINRPEAAEDHADAAERSRASRAQKVRVVFATPLRAPSQSRQHEVLVVLSDGSCTVLRV